MTYVPHANTDTLRKWSDYGEILLGAEIAYRHGSVVVRARPPLRTCKRCMVPRWLLHFPLRGVNERCRYCRRRRPDDPNRQASRRLRDARAHWSQDRAAQFMGVSLSMYKEWEGGSKRIHMKHWTRVDAMARETRGERRRGLGADRVATW